MNVLVQIHPSDLIAFPRELSPIPYLKEQFTVTLVGPKSGREGLSAYAGELGVGCFFGAETDVRRRFADCMDWLGIEYAVRILNHHFMVDETLITLMLHGIEMAEADYVVLPCDFDVRFGADVFSRHFLEAAAYCQGTSYRSGSFCPWAMAELEPDEFRLLHWDDVPTYGKAKQDELQQMFSDYYRDRTSQSDLSAYRFAAELLDGAEVVADLACGDGDGARYLAEKFNAVVGIDRCVEPMICIYDGSYHFLRLGNNDLLYPELFHCELDAIVSIHTMEHLPDDTAFLRNCQQWLRPGGRMVLEVPLLMRRPVGRVINPHHYREYELHSLKELCVEYFTIEHVYGVARGLYLSEDKARNAVMLVLRNDK